MVEQSEHQHGLASEIDRIRLAATDGLTHLDSLASAEAWEREWLGPKGRVTLLLRGLGGLPKDERPIAGRAAQALRAELEAAFAPALDRAQADALATHLASDEIDVTMPGR